MAAVRERLTKEIAYWDHRANELKQQELAGKQPRMNSGKARQRADDLEARLKSRMAELEQEKQLSPLPPLVIGGALIIPNGLIERLRGERTAEPSIYARETERVERLAVDAVLAAEKRLGRVATEMPRNNPGYDIRSKEPETGEIYFIEVKGRIQGAPSFTVTKTEILTALNKPEQFILAIAEVGDRDVTDLRYLRQPFAGEKETFFDMTSVNYEWRKFFPRAGEPA